MQRIWTLLVAAAAAAIATTALAQDVPAVQGASEAEKARILGLIEGAKKEGERHLLGRGHPARDQ